MSRLAMFALLPLGLAAPAAAPAQAAPPAQLTVTVYSFGFGPQPIRLAAGKPVTITFVNRSGSSHDFTAPGFFQHAKILAGAQGDEVDLRGHESKTITLVPAAGSYQAHCSHFMHKQMGMSDLIVVN